MPKSRIHAHVSDSIGCLKVAVNECDPKEFFREFNQKRATLPGVYGFCNVVLDFEPLAIADTVEQSKVLKAYLEQFEALEFKLVGVNGFSPEVLAEHAIKKYAPAKRGAKGLLSGSVEKAEEKLAAAKKPKRPETTVINGAIRGGQVVNAEGDLLIIGNVAIGTEISAGGSITIWGRLEGRAHAGTTGDEKAFIVANFFNPELISINGVFSSNEDIGGTVNAKALGAQTLVTRSEGGNALVFKFTR